MAELFGFRFEKVKDVGGEKFTLPAADDGTVEVAGGGFYGQVLDTDGRDRTEQDLVRRYRDTHNNQSAILQSKILSMKVSCLMRWIKLSRLF